MAKQITLSQLRQASEKAKQYVDAQATAQVIRTETVLWSGGAVQAGDILTLSQNLSDFDAIRIVAGATNGGVWDNLLRNSLSQEYNVSEFINALAIQMPILPRLVPGLKVFLSLRLAYDTATTIRVATIEEDVVSDGSTPDYMVGIYSITGIKYTVPETYSTSEQIVGTWIDGRPLYQKTMTFTATSLVNDWQVFPHNISNVDIMLFDGQKINPTNGETYDVNYYHTTGSDTFWTASTVGKTNVYFKASTNQAGQTLIYTLKYTKTT